MALEVLIVEMEPARSAQLVTPLEQAGFAVTRALRFEDALTHLRTTATDVLVTAVRLGAFNGLHLILRARTERPLLTAIVTSASPDPAVQLDAAAFGAEYMVAPWNEPSMFVDAVSRLASPERV